MRLQLSSRGIQRTNLLIIIINIKVDNIELKTKIPAPEVNVKAFESVFDKMYITNVEKRLRELNSPSDNDRKRWVWELIQNAKDTIAKDPNRNCIDVRIEVEGDYVWDGRFIHLKENDYSGWTNQELRDAEDIAYEGHGRLELGLE